MGKLCDSLINFDSRGVYGSSRAILQSFDFSSFMDHRFYFGGVYYG